MKRWVATKLKIDVDGALVPALEAYTQNFVCYSPNVPKNGDWVLCKVGIADLTAINADALCIVLPDLTLDATWGSLPANVRNAVKSRLDGFGIDVSLIQTNTLIRDVLKAIGVQRQAFFDPEKDDVADF